MFRKLLLFSFVTLLALFSTVNATDNKYWNLQWDSTSGGGYTEDLAIFNGPVTSKIPSHMQVVWRKVEENYPDESWHAEFCQGALYCWPYWVESDTINLPGNGTDTLQIKFFAGTPGTGSVKFIFEFQQTDLRDSVTIEFTAEPNSVRQEPAESRTGNGWSNNPGSLSFTLPVGVNGTAWLYDLAGRRVAMLWNGAGIGSLQTIAHSYPSGISAGVYILRMEPEKGQPFSRKITILR